MLPRSIPYLPSYTTMTHFAAYDDFPFVLQVEVGWKARMRHNYNGKDKEHFRNSICTLMHYNKREIIIPSDAKERILNLFIRFGGNCLFWISNTLYKLHVWCSSMGILTNANLLQFKVNKTTAPTRGPCFSNRVFR